jgi:uncharacterized membrane protein
MLRDRNPQHWKLGVFYFNPDEPRLFVAKRSGAPITVNLGRPMAWGLIVGIVAILAAGPIIDKLPFLR